LSWVAIQQLDDKQDINHLLCYSDELMSRLRIFLAFSLLGLLLAAAGATFLIPKSNQHSAPRYTGHPSTSTTPSQASLHSNPVNQTNINPPSSHSNDNKLMTISAAAGQAVAVPRSFLGLSLETWTIPYLAGGYKAPATPMVRLIKNLSGNGSPAVRIGGDSQDRSWWSSRSILSVPEVAMFRQKPELLANVIPAARGSEYVITPRWVQTVGRLLHSTRSPVTIGLNLAENNASHATGLASAVWQTLPHHQIQAFEVGNEPSLYWRFPKRWTKQRSGQLVPSKEKRDFKYSDLISGWTAYTKTLKSKIGDNVPLAGTALGCPGMRWCNKSSAIYNKFKANMRMGTVHVYALHQPSKPENRYPGNPECPTIQQLLDDKNTLHIGDRIQKQINDARHAGIPLRVDEFNTVPFGGAPGLSDRFAAALWSVDAMFGLRHSGVSGVNFHFGYGTSYRPFWIDWSSGKPQAKVSPIYYGMNFFAKAVPAHSSIQPQSVSNKVRGVSSWMLKDRQGRTRVVVINKTNTSHRIRISSRAAGSAKISLMQAPSLDAAEQVTWEGRWFGADGRLHGVRRNEYAKPDHGTYIIQAPASSAALIALPAA